MKMLFLAQFLFGLAAGCAFAQTSPNLEDYQWKNRLLLVFSPSASEPSYRELETKLQQFRVELEDRDLLVFHILSAEGAVQHTHAFSPEAAHSLRQRYAVSDEKMTLILIGKDGGEKARQVGDFNLQALFERIDAMPMRQREMRDRRQDENLEE